MKKFVAVLLACVLMAGASLTAFAADSPTAEGVKVVSGSVEVSELEDAGYDYATVLATLTDAVFESVTGKDADDYELINLLDAHYINGASGEVTVTFSISGLTNEDRLIVLHYIDGAWQQETVDSRSYSQITVTFSSLSPVAFYISEGTRNTGTGSSSSSSSDTTTDDSTVTSPTTGESYGATLAFAVVAVAAVGMVVSLKKRHA